MEPKEQIPFEGRILRKGPGPYSGPLGPHEILRQTDKGSQVIDVRIAPRKEGQADPFVAHDRKSGNIIELTDRERVESYAKFNEKPPSELLESTGSPKK
ncbi:hypothetical protein A3A49_02755 [Candidatus Curtissbacteria bacterium RIFCSPLOWO2_01_FULL_38_11b]|uniref:Uncharacterized protein n=1 Tax=Candidatus Curtissbacteria bacterium RIFCSPLOWO2_01_FULL_38_11b TaxID=1797725 RepID=A0A1F5H1H2_9BACT|nr:MAG: hypothetical protein A3A49_02755 [Candidatus Curtissbacteria bacterium RIFCSPLOWO2_01_FULL_38_11b]